MTTKLPGLRRSTANVLAIWLLQVGTLLFALISVPLITRRFGLEGLGVWLLVQQVAGHVQLLELGLASSLGRFLSRDKALSNADAYTAHASSAIFVLAGMGVVLVLFATPIGMVFPRVFGLPPLLASDAVVMLIIAIVVTGLTLPLRSALGALSSQHRFVLIYGSDGLALLLRIVLVVAACTLVEEHALVALALAVFLPGLLGALATFAAALRSAPYPLFNFRAVSAKPMRELLDVSFAAMLVTFAAVLLRQGSPMLVGYSLGVAALPLVALPVMLVASLGPFLSIGNQIISPIVSQLNACNRVAELRSVYLTASRYTLAAGLLMFAGMVLVVPYLLPLWLGRGVLEPHHAHLIYVNLLLVFGAYCLATPAFLARSVLVSVGEHKVAAKGEVVSVVAGLVVGWILMDIFDFGVLGMAFGIAAAYLFRVVGVLVRQLARYFDMPLVQMYGQAWWPPLLCALPLLLVCLPAAMGDQTLGTTAALAVLALGLWAWMVFHLIMPESHRERLGCLLRMAGRKEEGL